MSLYSNMSLSANLRWRDDPIEVITTYIAILRDAAVKLETASSQLKGVQLERAGGMALEEAMKNAIQKIATMTSTGEITPSQASLYTRQARDIYEYAVDIWRFFLRKDRKEHSLKLKKIQQAQAAVPFGSSRGGQATAGGGGGGGASSGARGGGGGSRTGFNNDIVRGGGGRSRSSFKKNYNSSKICTSKSQFGSTVSGTMQNSIAAAACSQGSGGSISGAVVEVQVVDVTRCIWTSFPRTKKVSKTFFKPGNKMFPPGQKATKNLTGKVEIFTSLPHNSVPQKVVATAGKLRLGTGKFGSGHLVGGKVAHKRDQANATTSMATISKLRWGYGAPMSFPKKEPMGTEAPRSCASCRSCKCAYSEEPLSQDVVSEGAVAVIETVAIVEKPSMEHKRTFTKKWRVCAKVCLFISRLKMTTKTVEVAVKDGQEVKSGPPSGFLQVAEDNLVEEAQKDLITSGPPPGLLQMTEDSLQEAAVKPLANENGQEAVKTLADENGQESLKPLANENGQEALKPLAHKKGQEAVKPVAIKNGQEVTSITSPGCQQVTESNLKEEALVDLDIKKLSDFIPFCKKVMDLLEGEIPLWAVGGHIMAKMKFPILDHSSPKPSCSCKKLTHGMVARTAWC